jgi:hypothetical protein
MGLIGVCDKKAPSCQRKFPETQRWELSFPDEIFKKIKLGSSGLAANSLKTAHSN